VATRIRPQRNLWRFIYSLCRSFLDALSIQLIRRKPRLPSSEAARAITYTQISDCTTFQSFLFRGLKNVNRAHTTLVGCELNKKKKFKKRRRKSSCSNFYWNSTLIQRWYPRDRFISTWRLNFMLQIRSLRIYRFM